MGLHCDPDILQDFLVEAGELLERLQEQLVELETRPTDRELLNAIFRAFHTVKGGAGFLGLVPMVDVCHITENVFDLLRQGRRQVTPVLMDVVLSAVDTVNAMFRQVRQSEMPAPADPQLMARLAEINQAEPPPATEAPVVSPPVAVEQPVCPEPSPLPRMEPVSPIPDLGMLAIESAAAEIATPALIDAPPVAADPARQIGPMGPAVADEITDDEFERLLDEIGKTKDTTVEGLKALTSPLPAPPVPPAAAIPPLAELGNVAGSFAAASERLAVNTPLGGGESGKDLVKEPVKDLGPGGATPPADTTVRVDTSRLDDIMNMVGELVLVRNRLVTLGAASADENMTQAVANLDVVTADLQMAVMKTRMQPIKKVFGRFPRVVRDLSRSLKKDIVLELVGEETDLDKNLVEALADPLVHLVRNAVDHGVEMPEVRVAHGKARQGRIVLSAEQAGDHILLSISDDGGGMDPDKLRQKVVEKGLLDKDVADRLNDKECFNLIFMPGFSTKSEISDISGRGVGMDVVKTKIAQLNGIIDVQSALGIGTKISIKVPLTLAILPTLMVILGKQTFAFPLTSVNEIFHLDLTKTNVVDGQLVVVVRDKALPLFYLKKWLIPGEASLHSHTPKEGHVVIVTVGTKRVGFVVDQLVGQEEVVIKPLGQMLQGTPGMAGATITGDGQIAMILDIPGLLKHYARNRQWYRGEGL